MHENTTPNTQEGDLLLPDSFQSGDRANPKLQVDGAAIGDAYTQFNYVCTKLDSSVLLPQVINANEAQQWDYNSVLDELVRVYDNTNKREETEEAEETIEVAMRVATEEETD